MLWGLISNLRNLVAIALAVPIKDIQKRHFTLFKADLYIPGFILNPHLDGKKNFVLLHN